MVIFQLAHAIIRQKIYVTTLHRYSYYTAVFQGVVLSNHKSDLNEFSPLLQSEKKKISQTGNRTRAAWVKARNPNP